MGKFAYYQLGKMTFDTKKQIHTYYSDMLNKRYSLNEKLDREDSEQLYHLLKYHPNFDEKVGVGVKFFRVETAVQEDVKWANSRSFYIHRHDGSKVNFSIKACYRFKDQIPKQESDLQIPISAKEWWRFKHASKNSLIKDTQS